MLDESLLHGKKACTTSVLDLQVLLGKHKEVRTSDVNNCVQFVGFEGMGETNKHLQATTVVNSWQATSYN